jgi:hypothetical protein
VIAQTKALARSICSEAAWQRIRQVRLGLWDAWHHVETMRVLIPTLVVGENRPYALPYEPSGSVHKILKNLHINYEQYGFVDFGSGKGRVLLAAAEFPFKSVEGVEFSLELHTIAENNTRHYKHARIRCSVVRSVLADAAEFQLPPIPSVLYFFNPFTGPVLTAVIDNIRKSLIEHPRDLIIICTGQQMSKEAFDSIPDIQVLWRGHDNTAYRLPHGVQRAVVNP